MSAERGQLVEMLCRAALPYGHKDQGAVVAVQLLEGYFDDSGTDGGQPFTTVAGYLGSPDRWGRFSECWARGLERWHLPEWKTSDWLARSKSYQDWGADDFKPAFYEFAAIIDDYARVGISISVRPDDYNVEIKPHLKRRHHAMADPFRWCVQALLGAIVKDSLRRLANEPVAVFVDKYAKETINNLLFNDVVSMYGFEAILPSFTHADSKVFFPLQAADLLASVTRRESDRIVLQGHRQIDWELQRLSTSVPLRVGHYRRESLAKLREAVRQVPGQITFLPETADASDACEVEE